MNTPTPKTEIIEKALKFTVKNGLYILAVVLGIFVIVWLYRKFFKPATQKKSGASVIEEFIEQNTAAGNTPTNTSNAVASIKQSADDVFEMYKNYGLGGQNCTASGSGKTFDIVLNDIADMGTVQIKALCQLWEADYAPKTTTTVGGFALTNPVSLYAAIEQEQTGWLGCLTKTVKDRCLAHLKANGCS